MHEMSIVQNLLQLVEMYAEREGAKDVRRIEVVVGVLSGVEPHLLRIAFDTFKEGTVAQNAQLDLVVEKLRLWCNSCNTQVEKEELDMICPLCGSVDTRVVGGDELLLKSIEMEV
ncbi:hydrogenase nickel insertion protein HypA [Thermocrinis albus DSM 14484]|uniref:Hydrogenase maturation factor HypA n=1 Tax=Thermocrinis albus (strain DSM 14484 / JCM 11386 / HI 11/12) TaxID=638303 RepID=D3SLP4_THEAH|nr:hydrogenase maturation nickel metallochaperone HypA [Thermocrinis albus]ADC89674.1 hydrogenase nickel insertion protein HypA [Thermocrinis albus DSM 14484]